MIGSLTPDPDIPSIACQKAEQKRVLQTNSTFQYRVSGIFIWNGGSWDVQGIYPEDTTSDGSYRDAVTVALISAHNQQVISSTGANITTVSAPPGSSVPSTGSGGGATTVLPSAAASNGSSVPGVQGPITSAAGRKLQALW